MKTPPKLTVLVLLAMPLLAVLHMGFYYGALPDKVASHFGSDGKADGYMSKFAFALFYIGMTSMIAVLFAGMGGLLRALPTSTINMPNRDYWLAPERKEATIQTFAAQMSQFGIATVFYLIAVMHSTILANVNGSNTLGPLFFVYFTLFIAFTIFWGVQITKIWQLPKASQ
jgi:uncharacterized membrane protein